MTRINASVDLKQLEIIEKEEKDLKISIKTKLRTIMKRDSEISKEFYESLCDFVIPQCNIWTFDAWNLAEYTIIYCLERKKDIPLLNENFFGDCLRYVSGGMMMKGEIENELLKSVIKKFDKHCHPNYELSKRDRNLRRGIGQSIEFIRDTMVRSTKLMLENFPIRYNKWIKLKHFEQNLHPNVQDITDSLSRSQLTDSQPHTPRPNEIYKEPILKFNNDLAKDKQIRAAYKLGMETYSDLISTAPDENGTYDNFTNNPKKLTELLQLLYVIKIDFENHINIDLESEAFKDKSKVPKKIRRPFTKKRKKLLDSKEKNGLVNTKTKITKVKGIKLFTFLPKKATFGINYLQISPSSVKEMRTSEKAFGKKKFFVKSKGFKGKDPRDRVNLEKVFDKDNDIFDFDSKNFKNLFKRGFKISSFTTDGVGCSVLFYKGKKPGKFQATEKEPTKKTKPLTKKEKLEKKEKEDKLKAAFKSKPLLGIDPGKKSLFTAYCLEKNRLDNLIDDVIKLSSNYDSDILCEEDLKESKKIKRRRKKRKKKKWKRRRTSKRAHVSKIPIISQNKPIPIDKTQMECTFSYSSKQ